MHSPDDHEYASLLAIATIVLLVQVQSLRLRASSPYTSSNLEQSNKSQLIIPDHFSLSMDKSKSMRLRLAQFLAEMNRYKELPQVPPLRLSQI